MISVLPKHNLAYFQKLIPVRFCHNSCEKVGDYIEKLYWKGLFDWSMSSFIEKAPVLPVVNENKIEKNVVAFQKSPSFTSENVFHLNLKIEELYRMAVSRPTALLLRNCGGLMPLEKKSFELVDTSAKTLENFLIEQDVKKFEMMKRFSEEKKLASPSKNSSENEDTIRLDDSAWILPLLGGIFYQTLSEKETSK